MSVAMLTITILNAIWIFLFRQQGKKIDTLTKIVLKHNRALLDMQKWRIQQDRPGLLQGRELIEEFRNLKI